jgi:hypothetical protein
MERSEDERAHLLETVVKRATTAALDEYEQRLAGGGVKIGWMGFRLEGKGRAVVGVLLALAVVAILMAGGYAHDKKNEEASTQRQKEHTAMEERLNEVVYVLTLSQQERERLNLSIPDSLRRKQIERTPRP